jgi:putative ABC transport system permease protein
MLDQLRADLRFAIRQYSRTPLLTATIVLVLAVGLSVNVALYTVVHSYLTNPVPGVASHDDLVRLHGSRISTGPGNAGKRIKRGIASDESNDYRRLTQVFASVAAESPVGATLRASARPDPIAVTAAFVTTDYFKTLGIQPELGPGLPAVDDNAAAALVAVIDHRIWQEQFDGRTDVAGQTIRVNDATLTVVGVAPAGFAGVGSRRGGTTVSGERAVWIPLSAASIVGTDGSYGLSFEQASSQFSVTVARLQPGIDADAARQPVGAVAAHYTGGSIPVLEPRTKVSPLRANNVKETGDADMPLVTGLAALVTMLVLLLTCTNVSSLLIGRALVRRGEIAIRLSLGASRRRVVRQLLAESAVLAVAAGAIGIWLIAMMTSAVTSLLPTGFAVSVDASVVAFTFMAALATTLIFGMVPALHASRESVSAVLKDGAHATRRSRLQQAFVVAQLTMTQPMLVALAVTFTVILDLHGKAGAASSIESSVVSIHWNTRSHDDGAVRTELARAAGEIPGVVGTAVTAGGTSGSMSLPPGERTNTAGRADWIETKRLSVSAGYFRLMDIPIVRGSGFAGSDALGGPYSVVIGNDLAQTLWGSADPIGKRLIGPSRYNANGSTDAFTYQVVGVYDTRQLGSSNVAGEYQIYGRTSEAASNGRLLIRTAGPARAFLPVVRALSQRIAPTMPIQQLATLEEITAQEQRQLVQGGAAIGAVGMLILALASIGLYAVVAFAVGQRRREIGVRMALGSTGAAVVRAFAARGLKLGVIGLALGLPLSVLAFRTMQSHTAVTDVSAPLLGAAVAALVLGVATIASVIPARRAAAVNPVIALRAE